MSATATIQSHAIAEWVKLFPRTVTENYTSSVTFMKQLTVIAISTVMYLKSVLPEDNYTLESFCGLKLRVLKKTCNDELAQFLSTALTQAFEAFEKRYFWTCVFPVPLHQKYYGAIECGTLLSNPQLHQLALCFYDGECKAENLMEYHIFEYSYNPEGVTMDAHSKTRDSTKRSTRFTFDNIKGQTINLIRTCVVLMQAYQNELPSSYDVSLRLYYNDDAPEGYQAPGFLSMMESEDHLTPTFGDAVKFGSVATPYHRMVALSCMKEPIHSSREAIPSQNPPTMTQNEREDFGSEHRSMGTDSESQVRCPCNNCAVDDQDINLLLTCVYCKKSQHAACYGISRATIAQVSHHCCAECYDMDSTRVPTDDKLAELSVKKRECLCIFRRVLDWCTQISMLSADDLIETFRLSHINAIKLLKLLQSHGVIEDNGSDLVTPKQIIKEELNKVQTKFFKTNEPNIVERLLAETLSQGSQPDPIGDVLSPIEKLNLQNISTFGRIVPAETMNVDDSTLNQYREAIANEKMDEIPLSGSHNPIQDMENIGKRATKRKTDKPVKSGVKTKRARANKDNK